jgi:hypothetical protein
VLILKHYFASKPFAALHEAFSIAALTDNILGHGKCLSVTDAYQAAAKQLKLWLY